MIKCVLGLTASLFLFSCAGTIKEAGDEYHAITYAAFYRLELESVERPDSAATIYGPAVLDSLPNDSLYFSSFEDAAVKILWGFNSRFIGFAMLNKTESSIRIMWNQGAYVDPRNGSHPLGQSQLYYLESAPSVILKKTHFEASIYPRDHPFAPGDAFGGPVRRPLFLDYDIHGPIDHGRFRTLQDFQTFVSNNMYARTQILLPMEIDGQIHNYLFAFRVTQITTERSVHDLPGFMY